MCRSRVLCNARKRTQDTYREKEGGLPRCFWIRDLSTLQGGYVRATNCLYYYLYLSHDIAYTIVMIRADFQRCMESVS